MALVAARRLAVSVGRRQTIFLARPGGRAGALAVLIARCGDGVHAHAHLFADVVGWVLGEAAALLGGRGGEHSRYLLDR